MSHDFVYGVSIGFALVGGFIFGTGIFVGGGILIGISFALLLFS